MNNLKNAVGLLNAQAPEGEFLAYINPDEAKMLKDAGGSGLLTPQGIPSFRGDAAYRSGSEQSKTSAGGQGNVGSQADFGGGGGNNNNDNRREQYSVARTTTPVNQPVNLPANAGNESAYVMSGGEKFAVDDPRISEMSNEVDQRNLLEKFGDTVATSTSQLLDFFSSGGIVGNIFSSLTGLAENYNKKRRNDFMSTADIKAYELGTGKNWNPNNVTNKDSAEYKYLKNETDYFQQFNNDDNRNDDDPSSFFDNPQDATFNNIATNPNPFSQVNTYFNNMGSSNLGMSNNFMTSYDQAKKDLAKTLNMTSNASQFGYNANMSASNIYYNYLKEQGLL